MRLQRIGRRNDPAYRIVVTDRRTGPKSNKHVDQIGSYHPKTKQFNIASDRVKKWLENGVQASPTVHNLLVKNNVIEGKKVNVLPKKSPIVDEEALKKAEEEAAAKAEAEKAEAEAETATDAEATEEAPAEESTEEAEKTA